jgi:hypothetical protein
MFESIQRSDLKRREGMNLLELEQSGNAGEISIEQMDMIRNR